MDKLKLWLIPGLIVIVVIGGLFFLRGRAPEAEITTSEVTEEIKEKKPRGFAKPVEPSPEEKLANDTTAMSDALRSGDISACDDIAWDEELRQKCLDELNYAAFLKAGDEDQCDQLSDEALRLECHNKIYISAAVDGKDLSVCDMISDPVLKQQCRDQVQVLISLAGESLDDCQAIGSTHLKGDCEDNFYLKDSVRNLDVDACENIDDPNLKAQCTGTVENNIAVAEANQAAVAEANTARTATELLAVCDDLSGDRATNCKDAVYPKLAAEERDLSHCDKISDLTVAQNCKAVQGQMIDQYYLRQAKIDQDPSLCNNIGSQTVKQICIDSV